ncbi:MAG: superoxide dismutase family protein, partial [Oligoflexia bacterium]|nr:superoxide dismutase family protein [Oligoflexia bacterium]
DLNRGKITGSVFFEKAGRYEVKVTADVKGLSPNKKFGFHIHEFGTCENKGLLAGGHLNPFGKKHAGPHDKNRHLGDLGNLESDKKGASHYSDSVKGRLDQFMGRSVIIHAQADDMKSQPTGHSGNRMACGVIVASMPPVQAEKPAEKKAVSGSAEKPAEKKAVSGSAKKPSAEKKAVSGSAKKPSAEKKAVSGSAEKPSAEKKAVSNKKSDTQKTGVSSVKQK